MSGSIRVDFDFERYAQQNIFNKLSKNSDYGFYYWPYGYLFRHVKWGGVNSLGFRIDHELENINEDFSDHYRIAFFGGSTGFDVLVPGSATLVTQLENCLNSDTELQKIVRKPIKIFNLSQPGNLVLNQIMNFTQFGHLIEPHLVICHSAANDLCTMQMNDPVLVNNYAIGYPDVLEAWGKKIHNAKSVEIDYQFSDHNEANFRPAKDRVSPTSIIDAYTMRVHQFKKLVQSLDIPQFVVGFQPWITSKEQLSESEKNRRVSYNPYYQVVYKNVEHMYLNYHEQIMEKMKPLKVADMHAHFKNLPSNLEHFGDTHHLLLDGNKEAAMCYYKKIKGMLLQ
jgi:hypothetical protein